MDLDLEALFNSPAFASQKSITPDMLAEAKAAKDAAAEAMLVQSSPSFASQLGMLAGASVPFLFGGKQGGLGAEGISQGLQMSQKMQELGREREDRANQLKYKQAADDEQLLRTQAAKETAASEQTRRALGLLGLRKTFDDERADKQIEAANTRSNARLGLMREKLDWQKENQAPKFLSKEEAKVLYPWLKTENYPGDKIPINALSPAHSMARQEDQQASKKELQEDEQTFTADEKKKDRTLKVSENEKTRQHQATQAKLKMDFQKTYKDISVEHQKFMEEDAKRRTDAFVERTDIAKAGVQQTQAKDYAARLRGPIYKKILDQADAMTVLKKTLSDPNYSTSGITQNLVMRAIGLEKGAASEGDVGRAIPPTLEMKLNKWESWLTGQNESPIPAELRADIKELVDYNLARMKGKAKAVVQSAHTSALSQRLSKEDKVKENAAFMNEIASVLGGW